MLEIKNLTKIYKPKRGVPVVALDKVSIKFPETGMVFLLGKSGCGKSTLLNLLGGLDKSDSGEIIIKGVSSRKFRQRHFDSYRNTYVGFIFQEYNILDEFTVGANIALAIELQGRRASNAELNSILQEVDLVGFGSRRPNELSGGQKQRVAIARALVKNPKIIMADEPSGALDSVTGKQVFDTLKKLSKDKLVIVVSHDRDFATQYADRIIELADGRIISDTSISENEAQAQSGLVFDGATAKISAGYKLTEEDRIAINEYMDKINSGISIELAEANKNKRLSATDESKIEYKDNSPFKLIKSKLALKHAFKIGGSGLKHKKFRLVVTILLSCISFVMFGLVDTFSAYNHISATADSLQDTDIKYATVDKSVVNVQDDYEYWYNQDLTDADLKNLEDATGVKFEGIISYGNYEFKNLGSYNPLEAGLFNLVAEGFSGIIEINLQDLADKGYKLVAGRLPDGNKDEIAISSYIFDCFKEKGYMPTYGDKEIKIYSETDMIGKALTIDGIDYQIVGIVDTGFDMERYSVINSGDSNDSAEVILDYVLYTEFTSAVDNDYTGMMMVGEGFVDRYLDSPIRSVGTREVMNFYSDDAACTPFMVTSFANFDSSLIKWFNEPLESLKSNEIVVSVDLISQLGYSVERDSDGNLVVDAAVGEILLEGYISVYETKNYDYYERIEHESSNYRIVGYINSDKVADGLAVISDGSFKTYFPAVEREYGKAIGTMPKDRKSIEKLAEYCYDGEDGVKYPLNNPASFELDALDGVLKTLADVFLYVGIGFAIFAAILLSNFIATSVAYKKREIGILRAIGSRGNDVFRIFFAEAFIIAMVNFLLAAGITAAVTMVINTVLREQAGLLITVLHFGLRQILVILGVSLGVAAIASFLPVKKIASKRPIDAIKSI